jgi:hypothetical protein
MLEISDKLKNKNLLKFLHMKFSRNPVPILKLFKSKILKKSFIIDSKTVQSLFLIDLCSEIKNFAQGSIEKASCIRSFRVWSSREKVQLWHSEIFYLRVLFVIIIQIEIELLYA